MAMKWLKSAVVSLGALVGLGFVPGLVSSLGIGFLSTAFFTAGTVGISLAAVIGVWAGIWLGEFVADQLKL